MAIKVKLLPRWPAAVDAVAPIVATKANGAVTLSYDSSTLPTTGSVSATAKILTRDGAVYQEVLASAVSGPTIANQRILGNISGGTAAASALTGAQVNTFLPAFTGDFGSGGVQGLVPAPPAGSAAGGKFLKSDGTWQPVVFGPIRTIEQYGGGTNSIDNQPFLYAALASLPSTGGAIYFGPGTYTFASNVTFTLANAISNVTIFGAGVDVTRLRWTAANGGITLNWANFQNSITVRDMTLTTTQGAGSGAAFSIASNIAAVGYQTIPKSNFQNLTIIGDNPNSAANYWETAAIYVENIGMVNFDNIHIYGGSTGVTPAGKGIVIAQTAAVPIVAGYNITNSEFNVIDYGVQIFNNPQGVTLNQCTFVDGNIGVVTTNTGGTDLIGLQILNCNFNSRLYGLYCENQVNDFMFVGNLVYIIGTTGSYAGIKLAAIARFTIAANDFVESGSSIIDPPIIIDFTYGWPGTVSGNIFCGSFPVGVSLTANSSYVKVVGNSFSPTIATPVSNSGTNNRIEATISTSGSASDLTTGTVSSARGGAGAINGALKGNGSGVVSQAAAADLSDYTAPGSNFTPVLSFGGASTGITYSTQAGSYTKIGKLVAATFRITLTSKGSSTGAAAVAGLPAAYTFASGVCSFYGGMSSATSIQGYVDGGGTFNFTLPGAAGISAVMDTNFTNNSDLICTVVYPSA